MAATGLLFPGERHQILTLPNGKHVFASFSGPGTHLLRRIKLGDEYAKPKTITDLIAKLHDIDYSLADDLSDIEKADTRMLVNLGIAMKKKLDVKSNILPAMTGIASKKLGEKLNIIKKDNFSNLTKKSDEEKQLLENEQKKVKSEIEKKIVNI